MLFRSLDEPTNDLDLPTLAVLENFLESFAGCLVMVSHDRYFMDRLVDHLLVFKGDGVIEDFPGNYAEYRNSQKDENLKEEKLPEKKQADTSNTLHRTEDKKRMSYKEKREFDMLEGEIASLREEKKKLESQLEIGRAHV